MSRDEVQHFLTALGSFTRSDIASILKTRADPDSATTVVAACAWLSSMDPHTQMPPREHFLDALETLAASKHATAPHALKLIAAKAANARIRVEAVRRLGRASAKVLHSLITGQSSPTAGFQGERINDDEFKQAAIQAIGEMAKPNAADTELVLGILKADVESRSDSALFQTAAESLCRLAKPSNLEWLADAATSLRDSHMALSTLSICAKYSRRALLVHADKLSDALVRSLHHLPKSDELQDRLCDLARKTTCAQLLEKLSSRYWDAPPHSPVGAVVWAAVEAYGPADAVLADACLALAKSGENAQPGGPWVHQLTRCAEAGHADRITCRITRMDGAGHKLILESGSLQNVLGGADEVVEGICRAFTEAPNVGDPQVYGAMRCVLALGIADCRELPSVDWLARGRMGKDGRTNLAEQIAEQLRSNEASMSPIQRLAQSVFDQTMQKGAIEIAARFAARNDELASLFCEVLLTTAGDLDCAAWEPLTTTPEFRRFEDGFFSTCEQWFKDHAVRFLMQDDRLNRYVLDVIRRRNLRFAEAVRTAARSIVHTSDADHLLDRIACSGEDNSVGMLAELTCFAAEDRGLALHVRKEAIRRTAGLCAEGTLQPEELRADILPHIHARFNDALEVRLAAYAACLHVPDCSSIVPLVRRRETEAEMRGKAAIGKALATLRKQLLSVRPDLHAATDCVSWIQHVRNLGIASMGAEIRPYLDPPHPNEDVVLAALECLAQLGGRTALKIVDGFLQETSPEGVVLREARRAKIVLQDRNDADLFEALSQFFPEDSNVLNPSLDYDALLGGRARRLAAGLTDSWTQWEAGHWGDFVTHLDAACDLLVRHLFTAAPAKMKLGRDKCRQLATKPYGNRLSVSQFRDAYPVLQAGFSEIHALRGEGTTAHVEEPDGTAKPGLTDTGAKFAMDQFVQLFPRYVAELAELSQPSGQPGTG